MPQDRFRARFAAVAALVLCAAALRIVPHPPNFTPVAAMALFAGARFDRMRWALAVPLCAMLLSDLALEAITGHGWHRHMPAVYASFVGCVGLGVVLRRHRGVAATATASLTGSLAFFFVTNFSVWALEAFYPHTVAGLATCYAAALPYLVVPEKVDKSAHGRVFCEKAGV